MYGAAGHFLTPWARHSNRDSNGHRGHGRDLEHAFWSENRRLPDYFGCHHCPADDRLRCKLRAGPQGDECGSGSDSALRVGAICEKRHIRSNSSGAAQNTESAAAGSVSTRGGAVGHRRGVAAPCRDGGVVSYAAGQRTNEISVRLALGAQRGDVIKLMVGQGMKLALIG